MQDQEKIAQPKIMRISAWKLSLALLGLTIGLIAAGLLIAGIFILVLPIMLAVGFAYWLVSKRDLRKESRKDIIEVDYKVIDE